MDPQLLDKDLVEQGTSIVVQDQPTEVQFARPVGFPVQLEERIRRKGFVMNLQAEPVPDQVANSVCSVRSKGSRLSRNWP